MDSEESHFSIFSHKKSLFSKNKQKNQKNQTEKALENKYGLLNFSREIYNRIGGKFFKNP